MCRMESIPLGDAFHHGTTVINRVDYWSFPSVNSVEDAVK